MWKHRFVISFLLSTLTLGMSCQRPRPQKSAKETITEFYQDYLEVSKKPSKVKLPFSKDFEARLQENTRICKARAGTDICGWGASGDVHTNTQDYAENLTFANSRFQATEEAPGLVTVKFWVFPEEKDPRYQTSITYKLIREDGRFVIDEMWTLGKSASEAISEENKYYLK